MARVVSGALLAAAFFAIVWFSSATVLLFVALAVCVLAFQEYAELMRRIGAAIPKAVALVATLAALAIVPFPYVAGEVVVGIGVVLIAAAVMAGVKNLPPDGQPLHPIAESPRDGGPALHPIAQSPRDGDPASPALP